MAGKELRSVTLAGSSEESTSRAFYACNNLASFTMGIAIKKVFCQDLYFSGSYYLLIAPEPMHLGA